MASSQLQPKEIEAMRQILADHDRATSPKVHDINNPPKEPYVHQDFPRMVYHAEYQHGCNQEGKALHSPKHVRVVNSQDEFDEAISDGWLAKPVDAEVEAPAARKKENKDKKEKKAE